MGYRNQTAVRKVCRGGEARWIIDFQFVDTNGVRRRYRRDAKVQSADGARREARQRQELATLHGNPEGRPAAMGFATFVKDVFNPTYLPRFRASTQRRYADLLRQWLLDHFADRPLDTLGADIQSLAAKLAKAGIQAKGPMVLLRTILRCAVDSHVLHEAPKVPRCWRDGRRLPEAPTDEEVERLVSAAPGWLRIAIALGAYAGLRSGEVRALEARDVDLVHGRLLVRRAFSDKVVTSPKSGHERVVPLAAPLQAILQEALRCKLPHARVVLNARGRTPGRQALLTALGRLEERVGVRAWSFHALRHAFLSTLVRRGASVEAVRLLAGHSNLGTTQRYVHASGGELRAAVDLLSGGSR